MIPEPHWHTSVSLKRTLGIESGRCWTDSWAQSEPSTGRGLSSALSLLPAVAEPLCLPEVSHSHGVRCLLLA